MHASHVSGDIHQIDFSEEPWQFRSLPIVDAMFLPDQFMHVPTGNFPIIDRIHKILSANDISTSKDVRFVLILHGTAADDDFPVSILDQGVNGRLGVLGPEGTDDIVGFDANLFIS